MTVRVPLLTDFVEKRIFGRKRDFSTSAMTKPGNKRATIAISMSFVTFLTTGASFFDPMGQSYVAASVSEKGQKNPILTKKPNSLFGRMKYPETQIR